MTKNRIARMLAASFAKVAMAASFVFGLAIISMSMPANAASLGTFNVTANIDGLNSGPVSIAVSDPTSPIIYNPGDTFTIIISFENSQALKITDIDGDDSEQILIFLNTVITTFSSVTTFLGVSGDLLHNDISRNASNTVVGSFVSRNLTDTSFSFTGIKTDVTIVEGSDTISSIGRIIFSFSAAPSFGQTVNFQSITPAAADLFAYVVNVISNDVSVIDAATNTVVATVPVDLGPIGVELCLILGDAAWSGGAGFGGVDDGDTIGELDAFDELGQLISPVQPAPGL